ncbi:MAG: hypothetical protein RR716_07995, partial [Christensenellaceae bacterium]
KDRIITELVKFAREFNKNWVGDNQEFLYMKIFKTTEELGKFVVDSNVLTDTMNDFEVKTGVTLEEWNLICKDAIKDNNSGEKFQEILLKNLSEVI